MSIQVLFGFVYRLEVLVENFDKIKTHIFEFCRVAQNALKQVLFFILGKDLQLNRHKQVTIIVLLLASALLQPLFVDPAEEKVLV